MLFHTLFTFRLGCVKYQISAAPANGMGVICSSKVHASQLQMGQQDNFTLVLRGTSNSKITERQLASLLLSASRRGEN